MTNKSRSTSDTCSRCGERIDRCKPPCPVAVAITQKNLRPPDLALELVLRAAWQNRHRQELLSVVKELSATAKLVVLFSDRVKREDLVESFTLLGESARIYLEKLT